MTEDYWTHSHSVGWGSGTGPCWRVWVRRLPFSRKPRPNPPRQRTNGSHCSYSALMSVCFCCSLLLLFCFLFFFFKVGKGYEYFPGESRSTTQHNTNHNTTRAPRQGCPSGLDLHDSTRAGGIKAGGDNGTCSPRQSTLCRRSVAGRAARDEGAEPPSARLRGPCAERFSLLVPRDVHPMNVICSPGLDWR